MMAGIALVGCDDNTDVAPQGSATSATNTSTPQRRSFDSEIAYTFGVHDYESFGLDVIRSI